jgi:hypothetical protein
MGATFGGPLLGLPAPRPATAVQPAAQCQEGLFGNAAPRQDASCAPATTTQPAVLAAIPAGFQESAVWSGLINPKEILFAADGRVFVAENSGTI